MPETIRFISQDGSHWEAAPELADRVRRDVADPLFDLESDKRFTLLKRNMGRSVFLMAPQASSEPQLIVKRHIARGLKEALKYCLWPSRAWVEWRMLRRLREAGIPCPRVFAMAERRRNGLFHAAALVMEYVAGATVLPLALRDAPYPVAREAVLDAVAATVRRIHDAGFDHHDLHAGNFLILQGPDGEPAVCPIDFHAVRLRSALSPRQRAAGLGKLCFSLETYIDRAEGARIVQAYLNAGAGRPDGVEPAAFLKETFRVEERLRRIRRRSRGKRCMKNSSVFQRDWIDGARAFRRRDFAPERVREALTGHADRLRQGDGVFKNGRKAAVTRVELADGAAVCVKEFKPRGFLVDLWRRFAGSKARRAWRGAHGLCVRNIGTPLPLACVETRRAGVMAGPSYLITECFEGARSLDVLMRDPGALKPLLADHDKRAALIDATVNVLAGLHAQEAHHADLAPKNWLARYADGRWEVALVDTDEVRLNRWPSLREKLFSMVQLYDQPPVLSEADRHRFITRYAARHPEVSLQRHCEGIRAQARARWERHCRKVGLSPHDWEPPTP